MTKFLQSIDTFVDELHWEETDAAKCDKIRALELDSDKWKCIDMFIGLLAVCVSYALPIQVWDNVTSMLTMHNKPRPST